MAGVDGGGGREGSQGGRGGKGHEDIRILSHSSEILT